LVRFFYFTKSFEKANRITQVIRYTKNDIQERVRRGIFLEMDTDQSSLLSENALSQAADETQGLHAPASDSVDIYEGLEQHRWLDLDGDGYQEPYVVTVRTDTCQVLRIVARFFDQGDVYRVNDKAMNLQLSHAATTENLQAKEEYKAEAKKLKEAKNNHIVRIVPQQYFTKYPFIPSPDGGFYDLGFGALLGPLNESVNTLINQSIDSGTMANTAGGFLGRGVKIKAGTTSFNPFEWKPVDTTGDDLRKGIFPLPVREPSTVLLQLLQILVSYSEKISGSTDIMTGVSPGQNTPAETSRNTIEQGMKIFSGIYLRMYRGFREELSKLYNLNRLYLESNARFVPLTTGDTALIARDDYLTDDTRVYPSADPAITSEVQRQQKAQLVAGRADTHPGYNRYVAEKELLEAYDITGIDLVLPDPQGENAIPPPKNQKMELELQKLELDKAKF
jgi:chaperonin GroES